RREITMDQGLWHLTADPHNITPVRFQDAVLRDDGRQRSGAFTMQSGISQIPRHHPTRRSQQTQVIVWASVRKNDRKTEVQGGRRTPGAAACRGLKARCSTRSAPATSIRVSLATAAPTFEEWLGYGELRTAPSAYRRGLRAWDNATAFEFQLQIAVLERASA